MILALSCTATVPVTGTDSEPLVQDAGDEPDLHFGGESDTIFDPEAVHSFEVITQAGDWEWLIEHAGDEEYIPVTVLYDDGVIEEVGLRFKGSWGSLYWCVDGTLDCDKLNLKMDFHEYREEQRFFDLKKLNFHAMEIDDSNTREHLAYTVWRAADVPASRTGWSTLTVNGQDLGLFLLVEQVDGRFTRHRWGDQGEGDLYEDVWFTQTSAEGWRDGLITNRDEEPTPEKMAAMVQDLASTDDFISTLGEYTDPSAINRFLAVSELTGSFDSVEAFYCGWNQCRNHNFLIYDKGDEVVLIPWDMDRSYDVPVPLFEQHGVPRWYEASDCELMTVIYDIQVLPPSCDPFFERFAPMAETYPETLAQVKAQAADLETLLAEVDRVEALIGPYVADDELGPGVEAWEASLEDLRADLAELDGRH